MFADFDFSLLDSPEFKEDSVREELIAPLIKALGYAASGPSRIVRSKSLTHPFVYIGTKPHEIKIIPDYVLYVGDEHRWVLDAKGPRENIRSGKNVEQAFSYAIHPEVRAFTYALCNGHELLVFQVNKRQPVLDLRLAELSTRMQDVVRVLSPMAFTNPAMLNYKPDFGLYMLKSGWSAELTQHFVPIGLPTITRVEDGLYTAVVDMQFLDEWYCISFDFNEERYAELLSVVKPGQATEIRHALRKQPYKINFESGAPVVCIDAQLGSAVYSNAREDYCPLEVKKFRVA